jgi:phosphotransferase system IIA component
VSSIQSFDNISGRFKTCHYGANQLQAQGDNFKVSAKQGYLVHMHQSQLAVQLNDLKQYNTMPISCDQTILCKYY